MLRNEIIAKRLMEIAAAHSVYAPQGWASHTCTTLAEAARILRGEPEPRPGDGNEDGVLSGFEPLGSEFERIWDEHSDRLYEP